MQMISADASTREITREFANLTPEKILRGKALDKDKYPSMARLKVTQGQEKTENAIAVVVGEAAVAFGEKMNIEDALDLAADIQAEYYYLTLEDVYIVMKRLKRQPMYGKLNLNKILTAFEQYKEERINKAAKMNWNNHLADKESPNKPEPKFHNPLMSPVTPGKKGRQ